MNDDDLPKPLPVGTPSLAPAPQGRAAMHDTLPPPAPSFAPQPIGGTMLGVGPAHSVASLLDAQDAEGPPAYPVRGLGRVSVVPDGPLPVPIAPLVASPAAASEEVLDDLPVVSPQDPRTSTTAPTSARPLTTTLRAGGSSHVTGRFPLRTSFPPDRGTASEAARQRRRSPDVVGLLPKVLSLFAWFVAGVAGTFYDRAYPSRYGLDALFGVRRSLAVVGSDLLVARALLMVTVVLGASGLALNSLRMRREGDRYSRSLIALCVGSFLTLVVDLANP